MMATKMTPSTTAAMKNVVAVAVHPRKGRFGPAPWVGGASDMSRGSLPIGSMPIGSLLMGVSLPGACSLTSGSSRSRVRLSPRGKVEQRDDDDADEHRDHDRNDPWRDTGVVQRFGD